MKRFVVSTILGGALLASTFGGAFAASDNAQLGVPGTPNCVGQTTAFVAQGGALDASHGIGGFADSQDLTVQELKIEIQAYCAGD